MKAAGIVHVAVLALMASTGFSENAGTSEWRNVSFPLQTTRVSLPREFNPHNPVVIVTHSNASPDYVLAVWIPKVDYECVLLVPEISFDGRSGSCARPDVDEDLIPQHTVWLRPGEEVAISHSVSNRYAVPDVWTNMTVDAGGAHELRNELYSFDRSGKLREIKLIRETSIDELRKRRWEYLENRRKLEERESRTNEARSTNATPVSGVGPPVFR